MQSLQKNKDISIPHTSKRAAANAEKEIVASARYNRLMRLFCCF
jgi:hypothetical protein